MSKFNHEKLTVIYLQPATSIWPVYGRKYTLTHSDVTGELFLSVGDRYDFQSINKQMRDEVMAEWSCCTGKTCCLIGHVLISCGEFNRKTAERRYAIFLKEMETALEGMILGDRHFFQAYPQLLDCPIAITFHSIYPAFHKCFYYGTPRRFFSKENQQLKLIKQTP